MQSLHPVWGDDGASGLGCDGGGAASDAATALRDEVAAMSQEPAGQIKADRGGPAGTASA